MVRRAVAVAALAGPALLGCSLDSLALESTTKSATGCKVPELEQPVRRAHTAKRRVSLTFDEPLGPRTRKVLAALSDSDMHATFFALGAEVEAHPAIARAVLAQGSELGNHSFTHRDPTSLHDDGRAEMRRTNRAISRATGFRPCLFRPPGGQYDGGVLKAATSLGLTTVTWNASGLDLFVSDPADVAAQVLEGLRPGAIILLHQRRHSVAAVPKVLAGLRERGLRSVPVTELLGGRFLFPRRTSN